MNTSDAKTSAAPDRVPISCQIGLDFGTTSENRESTTSQRDRFDLVLAAARDFRTTMKSLWQYASGVRAAAQSTRLVNFAELGNLVLKLSINDASVSASEIANLVIEVEYKGTSSNPETEEIRFRIHDPDDLRLCTDLITSSGRALSLLHQTTLQQAVVLFERLLGEIIFHATLADCDNAYLEDQLTAREILELESFEQAKEFVAYRQTEKFLKEDTRKQLQIFKEKLKVDLYTLCKTRIPELLECVIRRHAIVHGTSFSAHEYWRKRDKIAGLPPADKSQSVDELTSTYISRAWQAIFAVGIVAAHAVLHRIANASKNDEQKRNRVSAADIFLNHSGYEAITIGRYQSAEDVLRYYLSDHHGSGDVHTHRLMAKVNLIQTLKWSGKNDELRRELKDVDVDSLNLQYQLCIAALRDDEESFDSILPKAASEKLISVTDLLEWPVFRKMRDRSGFKELVARAFKVNPAAIPDFRIVPFVLGPTPERLEAIVKKIRDTADTGPKRQLATTITEVPVPPTESCQNQDARPNGEAARQGPTGLVAE